ncbi:hypothetical protein [Sphaerisporangium fuscum]|uniref:hypothetical protein n=1 Tax=Sphaerisporangium fuscum TaxID=2835868 RepID=UPI001BDCE447|nr:hypothetical protein [Sphaerisporangium fuscum]
MTNTTEPDVDVIVRSYVAVWSEPDPEARRRAVAGLWAPDGVEFVEGARFRGHEELDARITEAYEQFVGSGDYIVTAAGDTAVHDDIVTFTVQLVPAGGARDGEAAWAARVFLLLGGDGLIREDYHLTVKPLVSQ